MKLKTILIDDEKDALFALRKLLEEFCEGVEVCAEATSALSGLRLIQQHQPDVVFLDVEMPGGNGFDLLETLKTKPINIVFTTAYEQYAINALRAGAVDYLLKPIDLGELRDALMRVRARFERDETMQQASTEEYKIKIAQQGETFFIPCVDILYIEGEGRYSTIHITGGKKHLVSKNLKEFEDELSRHRFFRIHKSFLVNCRYVSRITHSDGGFVELSNGKQIEISRRRKMEFQEFMKQ
ncbi:MAG: two component transcriptional regulator, LytTR family [Bacteroidetes bacterium]|nr:MAG: two component transcriptional regulator, LytTR family [Bacteroidota bacterium]